MRNETEIGLMKRLLGLFKDPYGKAREACDAPIKAHHDGLLLLLEPGHAYRAIDLARRCNVTPSAISHVLKELVWLGLVDRKPGKDLRSISIEITPQGVQTRAAIQQCVQQINDDMLSVLAEAEQKTLRSLLEKLIHGIEESQEQKGLEQ